MSRRSVILLGLAVLLAHGLVFAWLANRRVLPQRTHVPRPNFIAKEGRFQDAETGEVRVYREFTVSTRLRESAELLTGAGAASPAK